METKYYAYYKPPHNVELMNNIKDQLSQEYSQEILRPLLLKIFNNINNNDTDEYLCADKQNHYLILIKFTHINDIFIKEENIDKSKYTLISKSIEWNAKKLKINNSNQYYNCETTNYYNKTRTILFNGSSNNYPTNNTTQYIFAEYLNIPITNLIILYQNINFDVYISINTNINNLDEVNKLIKFRYSEFTKLLTINKENGKLTENFIINIFTILNTILANSIHINNFNDILLLKKIIPYINDNDTNNTGNTSNTGNINDSKIQSIWNEIIKQPVNVYEVFSNHKLIIDNTINYNSYNLNQILQCNLFSYVYITQKQFNDINYKDALPFRLSFDSNFKYNALSQISINHNKEVDNIVKHNNEIVKYTQKIDHLLRTKPSTDSSIIRIQDNINFHESEIEYIKARLLKIDPYYKDHLLFNTNTGFKLTFEQELNSYKTLLYLRYMCNNYSRLNNDLLFCYDNIIDKRNDILQFYVSNTLLNNLITMKIKPDLFTLSRFFNINTEDKYQDGKFKINNHEINKSFEIVNKTSRIYKNFCKFLDDNINLKLFEYQKNNLLWMLQLEDNIDLKKIIIESYINKFNINYSYNNSTINNSTINNYDIKTYIYQLKSYIPEVICKDYFINVANDKKYIIDIKNNEQSVFTPSLISSLNANNSKNYSKNSYTLDFNLVDSIITTEQHKDKYIKNIEFCGGAICDEVGLGKTLSIISHLVLKLKHDMLKFSNYKTEINNLINILNINDKYFDNKDNANNIFIDPLDKGFEYNNLIIVPSRLTSQWENEIEKYVKNKFNLRAKVLIGINSIKALEKELKEFKKTKASDVDKKKVSIKKNVDMKNGCIQNIPSIDTPELKYKIKLKLKTKDTTILNTIKEQSEIKETNTISIINNSKTIIPIDDDNGNTIVVHDHTEPIIKKLSTEEKMIAKLMLKAKKNSEKANKKNTKNTSQSSTTSTTSTTSLNTIDNILNNDISINIDESEEASEEASEEDRSISVSNEPDTNTSNDYDYLDKYLKYHQSNTKEVDNDYLNNQLYDVYIISSNLLINENYLNYIGHTSDNHLAAHYTGETKDEQQKNKLNIIKNLNKDNKICRLTDTFNIYKIKWNRVILDEAHEKLSPTIKIFSSSLSKYINRTKSVTFDAQFIYENLCIINSNYKWAMTGTPTEHGIDSVIGLLEFLRVKDYNEDILTKIEKIRYLHDTVGISPNNLDTILNTIFKKTFKKDVKTLLNIPLFTEEIIYVEQNNIERNIYNSIRCSRHFSEVVKLRTLFLMCTNILISNEFDVDGECDHNTRPGGGSGGGAEPEFLTLEQLNTNMIAKFNQQLKQLVMNKSKLIKINTELASNVQEWLNLCDYICGLDLDDCIEPRILQDISSKFGDIDNNRIRDNCEIFYKILNIFEVRRNIPSLGFILSSNINMIRDHLYRSWDNNWSTNQQILIKCSHGGAKLGVIKVKDEISRNEKKINSFDTDKTRINNQIALFSSNDFLTDKSKDPCIICFDDLTDIVVTPCRHIFCLTCTKKLSNDLKCNFTCPECRSIVDYKTVNITNIDMINKKDTESGVEVVVDSVETGTGVELTALEKKLGKDWKNKCINRYGSKMQMLITYLYTIFDDPVNRVIIFSQYEKMLKMIAKTLSEYSIKFVHCSGNNYVVNRNIMKFKKDESYRVILLSSELSNSGSTLTEANFLIFCDVLQHDTEQTKAIESQAIGRMLRISQQKNTKIVRFITKGTIEEEHYNNTKYDINILQN